MRVFIWKGRENADARAQAMQGYNDDLVMSWFIGLFLRDTAIRFRQTAQDLTYATLNNFSNSSEGYEVYNGSSYKNSQNPWQMPTQDGDNDITWLLG
jgi:hypothetical protein